jgi:hypothetical protein
VVATFPLFYPSHLQRILFSPAGDGQLIEYLPLGGGVFGPPEIISAYFIFATWVRQGPPK